MIVFFLFLNLSIDPLLQIHTIHNLLEVLSMQGEMQQDEMEVEKLEQDLVKLESKCMKPCADKVSISV